MIESVIFMNRKAAEQKLGSKDQAIISITQPNTSEATLHSDWFSVLRIEFDDINPDAAHPKKRKVPRIAMTTQDAMTIVKYVYQMAPCIKELVVHCQGGVSRSAAVAKWVAEAYQLHFNHSYDLYNKHVYKMLTLAAKRIKHG